LSCPHGPWVVDVVETGAPGPSRVRFRQAQPIRRRAWRDPLVLLRGPCSRRGQSTAVSDPDRGPI